MWRKPNLSSLSFGIFNLSAAAFCAQCLKYLHVSQPLDELVLAANVIKIVHGSCVEFFVVNKDLEHAAFFLVSDNCNVNSARADSVTCNWIKFCNFILLGLRLFRSSLILHGARRLRVFRQYVDPVLGCFSLAQGCISNELELHYHFYKFGNRLRLII